MNAEEFVDAKHQEDRDLGRLVVAHPDRCSARPAPPPPTPRLPRGSSTPTGDGAAALCKRAPKMTGGCRAGSSPAARGRFPAWLHRPSRAAGGERQVRGAHPDRDLPERPAHRPAFPGPHPGDPPEGPGRRREVVRHPRQQSQYELMRARHTVPAVLAALLFLAGCGHGEHEHRAHRSTTDSTGHADHRPARTHLLRGPRSSAETRRRRRFRGERGGVGRRPGSEVSVPPTGAIRWDGAGGGRRRNGWRNEVDAGGARRCVR